MPHVLFVAPNFPAGQLRFVRGLKRVGAHVTGIGEVRYEHLGPELRHLLDGYEHVETLADEEALTAAVRRVQARGPWVNRLESTLLAHLLPVARVRASTAIPGTSVEEVTRCAAAGVGPVEEEEASASGHQGFYDTLLVDGEVVFEAATHYYPNVLEALRTRWISPQVVHTNRLAEDGYDELRALGRRVIGEIGLGTTATHMEWFKGQGPMVFSEIGARPPGGNFWDLYCEANELDLHAEWARAVCYGTTSARASQRYAAGLINLRPSQDGTIVRYDGLEAMQRRYGELIFKMHLPPPGTATQPIEAGYLANAWMCVKHTDYDTLRAILEDIGRTVKVIAS